MAPSSELGEHPFAMGFNAKTGRPVRKARKSEAGSPFVDSAVAVSDPEDDGDDYEKVHADTIAAKRSRKRRRSPSPPLPSDRNEEDDSSSISSDSGIGMSYPRHKSRDRSEEVQQPSLPPLQLTFNVPKGHQGPFVVNLDLRHVLEDMAESIIVRNSPGRIAGSQVGLARPSLSRACSRSKSASSARAGFLDLPAELRNEIYRLAFVTPADLDFARPTNFGRSAQLLATCHQVHEEGRSILYAENYFYFNRRTERYGSFWENDWNEIGYRSIRKFLKSIGPFNTGLIRHVTFLFEDAVPSLNPRLTCNEERRFVHDDALMSVLRHLGDYAALQDMTLHFAGRKHLMLNDTRFIENLKRVRADHVIFAQYASPRSLSGGTRSKIAQNVEEACMRVMTRRDKLFASAR